MPGVSHVGWNVNCRPAGGVARVGLLELGSGSGGWSCSGPRGSCGSASPSRWVGWLAFGFAPGLSDPLSTFGRGGLGIRGDPCASLRSTSLGSARPHAGAGFTRLIDVAVRRGLCLFDVAVGRLCVHPACSARPTGPARPALPAQPCVASFAPTCPAWPASLRPVLPASACSNVDIPTSDDGAFQH